MIILVLFHPEPGNFYMEESHAPRAVPHRARTGECSTNLAPVLLRMCDAHSGPKEKHSYLTLEDHII